MAKHYQHIISENRPNIEKWTFKVICEVFDREKRDKKDAKCFKRVHFEHRMVLFSIKCKEIMFISIYETSFQRKLLTVPGLFDQKKESRLTPPLLIKHESLLNVARVASVSFFDQKRRLMQL